MGYAPPPSGVIVLPENVTYRAAELIRRDLEPQLMELYQVWSLPQMRVVHPSPTSYQRYIYDLYGVPGRNWLPFLSHGLLVSLVALVVAIVMLIAGVK